MSSIKSETIDTTIGVSREFICRFFGLFGFEPVAVGIDVVGKGFGCGPVADGSVPACAAVVVTGLLPPGPVEGLVPACAVVVAPGLLPLGLVAEGSVAVCAGAGCLVRPPLGVVNSVPAIPAFQFWGVVPGLLEDWSVLGRPRFLMVDGCVADGWPVCPAGIELRTLSLRGWGFFIGLTKTCDSRLFELHLAIRNIQMELSISPLPAP